MSANGLEDIKDLKAKVARLQEALYTVAWMFDRERQKSSPYYPRTLSEDGMAELGLKDTDMPPREISGYTAVDDELGREDHP